MNNTSLQSSFQLSPAKLLYNDGATEETMSKLDSHKRVYKVVDCQEIDVDVYVPSGAKRCPASKHDVLSQIMQQS